MNRSVYYKCFIKSCKQLGIPRKLQFKYAIKGLQYDKIYYNKLNRFIHESLRTRTDLMKELPEQLILIHCANCYALLKCKVTIDKHLDVSDILSYDSKKLINSKIYELIRS